MEHAANADFLGGSGDAVIDLAHTHELERLHPVAQVVKHEHEVVVVLEGLAFHARNGFQFFGGILVLEQLANLVLHEPGEFEIEGRIAVLDGLQEALQFVFIKLREFRQAVVRQQVGEFLGFTGVVLLINGNDFTANQKSSFQSAMTANDEPAAFADRDRIAPALLLNDRRQQLDLMSAVLIRVARIGLQRVRVHQLGVRAVNGDAHAAGGVSTRLTLFQGMRDLRMAMKLPKGVTPKKFARALKEWRERKDFSQRDAAEYLEISKRTLENWEQARATPRGYAVVVLMKLIAPKKP